MKFQSVNTPSLLVRFWCRIIIKSNLILGCSDLKSGCISSANIFALPYLSARGGRPTTTIFRPSHILLIFSSEPPRNYRPSTDSNAYLQNIVYNAFSFFHKFKNCLIKFSILFFPNVAGFLKNILIFKGWTLKKNTWTRIMTWLGRENEENVARTRYCCGCPSSPHGSPSRYGAHTFTVIFTWVCNQTNTRGGGGGGKEVEAIVRQAQRKKRYLLKI